MSLLLLQMVVVLSVTLGCGMAARKIGQARVVGEIVGGLLLGPSLLGRVAPHAASILFPPQSLGALEVLSGLGLILFLFLMGMEMDYEQLRRHKGTATLASALGILLPFLMAVLAAPHLYRRFSPAGTGSVPFTLFLGIAMSITAFPVLARMLEERGMQSTSLGTTALLCAAVDDVCAWLLLAVALTLLPEGAGGVPITQRLVWFGVYLLAMVFVVRPVGRWLAQRQPESELSYEGLAMAMAMVLASAAATEAIGVHPLFGAFMAGLCFPRVKSWQTTTRTRLETVTSVLLLPLFFALTGLRTRLDLLHGAAIWFWTVAVLLMAMTGKIGGAVLAARWTGEPWQHAWALGVLLNTRGLVELIVLNIAYNAHVFSPTLFTMMVMMALVTTMATAPLLNLIGVERRSL